MASSSSSPSIHRVKVASSYTFPEIGFDTKSNYSKDDRLYINGNILQSRSSRACCETVACWIFCCICLPCCEDSHLANESIAFQRFSKFYQNEYGEEVNSLAQKILVFSLIPEDKENQPHKAYPKHLPTTTACQFIDWGNFIRKMGVQAIKAEKQSNQTWIALRTQMNRNLEVSAQLIRLYVLYTRFRNQEDLETIIKEVSERTTTIQEKSKKAPDTSKMASEMYDITYIKTYLARLIEDYFSNVDHLADRVYARVTHIAKSTDLVLEVYVAHILYEIGDVFPEPQFFTRLKPPEGDVASRLLSYKLTTEEWKAVTQLPIEAWPVGCVSKFLLRLRMNHNRSKTGAYYGLNPKATKMRRSSSTAPNIIQHSSMPSSHTADYSLSPTTISPTITISRPTVSASNSSPIGSSATINSSPLPLSSSLQIDKNPNRGVYFDSLSLAGSAPINISLPNSSPSDFPFSRMASARNKIIN